MSSVPKILFYKSCSEDLNPFLRKKFQMYFVNSKKNYFRKIFTTNNLKVSLKKDIIIILKIVGCRLKLRWCRK